MTRFTYSLEHLTSATDITDFVEQIEATESLTGKVSHAKLRLNAFRGKFIQKAPVIDQFDRFKLTINHAGNTFLKIYELLTNLPLENSQEGNVIELEVLGLEHNLQKFHFSKQFFFETPFVALRDIIDQWNDPITGHGSLQPDVEDHDNTTGNELPEFISNDFEFNISETYVYEGAVELVNRLGNSTNAGGGGDFWEIFFERGSDDTKIKIRTPVSGAFDSGIIVTDASAFNEDPSEGGIDSFTGSVVGAWGADGLGTLPPQLSEFDGLTIAFQQLPIFNASVSWPAGAYTEHLGIRYLQGVFPFAGPDTTNVPPAAPWVAVELFEYMQDQTLYTIPGPSLEYSFWTNDLADEWKNSGCNPEGTGGGTFELAGFWDSTLVVFDEDRTRTWVDARATSPALIPGFLQYVGTKPYRGLRALVDGVGTGAFAGEDNNVMEFTGGPTGVWVRKLEMFDDFQCAVIRESLVYELVAGTWTDISTDDKANDCFHPYTSVGTFLGVNGTFSNSAHTTTFGDTSAIQVQYDWDVLLKDPITGAVTGSDTPNYYKVGSWINIRFPFPISTLNAVAQIGEKYGDDVIGLEPATIDANNMHLSHSGFAGFNNLQAEDLGPLSAFNFNIRLQWLSKNGGFQVQEANFKMRCIMYDTSDNVVVHDFVIPFQDKWAQISLPLSGFQIYRARTPLRFLDTTQKLVTFELGVEQRFQYRNIKQICIQWQESYDEQGRYDPAAGRPNISTAFTLGGRTIMTIDAVHFGKPLFTTTAATQGIVTDRVLQPPFMQLPFIVNMQQLRQASNSQLEIEKFQHKQFEVRTDGALDIPLASSFQLRKARLVSDADGAIPNNIVLVAKEITYKISKPHNRPGKFQRFITGVKRFT
ncbi:hypothetical protein KAR91_03460 [Candidatus Pacearchaeota archaeon]|nr:hypothetical protein [Candidatus Pacearchaeota archaeon]